MEDIIEEGLLKSENVSSLKYEFEWSEDRSDFSVREDVTVAEYGEYRVVSDVTVQVIFSLEEDTYDTPGSLVIEETLVTLQGAEIQRIPDDEFDAPILSEGFYDKLEEAIKENLIIE